MQNVTEKILNRIYGKKRGWVFSQVDFADIGTRDAVDQALSRLARRNTIRRLARGLYEYPRYSDLFKRRAGPEIDQVAEALARKHSWDIVPDEATSLQLLGLDTQVPAQYRYLSSGPNAEYDILGTKLVFAHRKQQRTSLHDAFTATLVQALHALGKDEISDDQRERLASLRSARDYDRVLRWTKSTTAWVHEEIRRIAEKAQEQDP